ncbi:MAG: DUF2252 family protein [Nocardioidaceae bacterium]
MTPDSERSEWLVDMLVTSAGGLLTADRGAYAVKFRKMAVSPVAFYRGSAALFYSDLDAAGVGMSAGPCGRLWIHGDLHAQNFGTYLNTAGHIVFDVNDFDEACIGPFDWDLRRLTISLALLGYSAALGDTEISGVLRDCLHEYLHQVEEFDRHGIEDGEPVVDEPTEGPVLALLNRAARRRRAEMLDEMTVIEQDQRRFHRHATATDVDSATTDRIEAAFAGYLDTIPPGQTARPERVPTARRGRPPRRGYRLGRPPSVNLLLRGSSRALEDRVVLYMKRAQPAAAAKYVNDPDLTTVFAHDGERTVSSARALQAHTDRWLGYTMLEDHGQLVAEVSPYALDLDWADITELPDFRLTARDLGRATARIHCVADASTDQQLVPVAAERVIHQAVAGRETEFVDELIGFAHDYASKVREDHQLFVDAFRNHHIPDL